MMRMTKNCLTVMRFIILRQKTEVVTKVMVKQVAALQVVALQVVALQEVPRHLANVACFFADTARNLPRTKYKKVMLQKQMLLSLMRVSTIIRTGASPAKNVKAKINSKRLRYRMSK